MKLSEKGWWNRKNCEEEKMRREKKVHNFLSILEMLMIIFFYICLMAIVCRVSYRMTYVMRDWESETRLAKLRLNLLCCCCLEGCLTFTIEMRWVESRFFFEMAANCSSRFLVSFFRARRKSFFWFVLFSFQLFWSCSLVEEGKHTNKLHQELHWRDFDLRGKLYKQLFSFWQDWKEETSSWVQWSVKKGFKSIT